MGYINDQFDLANMNNYSYVNNFPADIFSSGVSIRESWEYLFKKINSIQEIKDSMWDDTKKAFHTSALRIPRDRN